VIVVTLATTDIHSVTNVNASSLAVSQRIVTTQDSACASTTLPDPSVTAALQDTTNIQNASRVTVTRTARMV